MPRTKNKGVGQGVGGGRPEWQPTDDERKLIEHYVAQGYTRAQIAKLIGKSEDSLTRHCKEELELGDLRANSKVGGALFNKAMKGDVGAIVWWEKTRGGRSDKTRHEHSGPDGGPIPFDLSKLSDKELEELERLRGLIALAGGNSGGEGAPSA
jgi:hypothetical protein